MSLDERTLIIGLISLCLCWLLARRGQPAVAWVAAIVAPLLIAEAAYWCIYLTERSDKANFVDYTGWDIAFTLSTGLPCMAACLILVGIVTYRLRRQRGRLLS